MARCANLKSTYVLDDKEQRVDVLSIVIKFKHLLMNFKTDAFGKALQAMMGLKESNQVISILDSIKESIENNIPIPVDDERMEKLLLGIYRIHLPDNVCNLTDFLKAAFAFDAEFRPAVVQMIVMLWHFSRKVDTSRKVRAALEALIQTVPFLCKEQEFDSLLPPVVLNSPFTAVKEVDLVSRVSALKFPSSMEPHGSIQEAGDWLQSIGVNPSNKFFVWSS
jgi:hypothetical protein